jgi:hypothetical protein
MLVTHEGGVSGEASIRQDTETVGKASSRGEAATPRETSHPRETVGNAYPRRKENLRTSWRTEVPAAYTGARTCQIATHLAVPEANSPEANGVRTVHTKTIHDGFGGDLGSWCGGGGRGCRIAAAALDR